MGTFTPHRDKVFVTEMDRGLSVTQGGIYIPDDDMKGAGIKSRWARVYAVGSNVIDLKVGDWVLMAHGRWASKIEIPSEDGPVPVWMIEYPDGVLLVSDEDPRTRVGTEAGALTGYSSGS